MGSRQPAPAAEPIGEIWFEDSAPAALLVKYLFTSDRLSVQVHPGDAAARAARPRPRQGRGLVRAVRRARRGRSASGSPTRSPPKRSARPRSTAASSGCSTGGEVRAGETFYSPAGTVHAIGGGLSLIEIQQNLDLTYRLYDYGRPRELHVDEAVAVADPRPWTPPFEPVEAAPGRNVLAAGGAFVVERWTGGGALTGESVVVPLASGGSIDGEALEAGTVWRVDGTAMIEGGDALVAYPGGAIR